MAKIVWNYIKFVSVGAFAATRASCVFVYFISAHRTPTWATTVRHLQRANQFPGERKFISLSQNDNNFATHSSTLIAEPHTHFSAIHLFGRGIFCVVNFQINANVIKRNWKRKRKQLECFTWLVKLFVWIFHLFLCLMRHVPTPVDTK